MAVLHDSHTNTILFSHVFIMTLEVYLEMANYLHETMALHNYICKKCKSRFSKGYIANPFRSKVVVNKFLEQSYYIVKIN